MTDSIARAPIDDVGPLGTVPKIIGLCQDHGWWFEMRHEVESCPQGGCLAKVQIYEWARSHLPESEPA